MRGHEELLAMRRRGKRPAHVTLHAHDGRAYDWWATAELMPFPEVQIEPTDTPELLDLRFLVSLPVIVDCGPDIRRQQRFADTVHAAGAAAVYPVEERAVWR